MIIRAHVQPDYPRHGIGIHLIQDLGGERYAIGQPTEIIMAELDDQGIHHEPTLRIPDALGRSLLDALTTHYGGATDLRSLRKDYDAERARVDRLIGHLIGLPHKDGAGQ